MNRWYVAYTHLGAEVLAEGQLQQQGFGAYLPRCLRTIRHARRVRDVIVPLFPRYIFVEIDMQVQRWRSINGTRGVSYLVSMGDRPAAVPDGIVDEIRSRETDGNLIEIPRTAPYETGETVEITAGALADQVGKFIRVDARQRVVLLLELLGRGLEVSVPTETVRAYA